MGSEAKKGRFTPGPWTSDKEPSLSAIRIRCADFDTPPIAHVHWSESVLAHFPERWGRERAEANARLIAAAPDLLEACKAAVEWEKLWQKGAANGEMGCLGVLRAAIARAEGGAA